VLVSVGGAVTDSYTFRAFGEEVATSGSTVNPLRYVGAYGYYREGAARYYVRARWLDVAQGRWLSRDPVETRGDDFYRYGGNIPTTFIDPTGLFSLACAKACCCCPDGIKDLRARPAGSMDLAPDASARELTKELLRRLKRETGLDDFMVGHRFNFKAQLQYVPAEEDANCGIEWWECSDDPPRGRALVWTNDTATFLRTDHSKEWRAEMERSKTCPDSRAVPIYDIPTLKVVELGNGQWDKLTRRRFLYIYVRIRKGNMCDCPNSEVVLRIRQDLAAVRGRPTRAEITLPKQFPGGDPAPGKRCDSRSSTQ
jgi:RHS repeat-associated protein